jgi:hypothetical protein
MGGSIVAKLRRIRLPIFCVAGWKMMGIHGLKPVLNYKRLIVIVIFCLRLLTDFQHMGLGQITLD